MKVIKRLTIIFIVLILFVSSQNAVFADEARYYAGGFPLGFDLSGEGALIVGLSEVICEDDIYLPARDAGLKSGDYIISLNGKKISSISDIDSVLKSYRGGPVVAEILADGNRQVKNIYPNIYKIYFSSWNKMYRKHAYF